MNKAIIAEKLFFSKTRDYLDSYLVLQCGKSKHTVKSYRDALTVFRRYVLDEKCLSIKKFRYEDCSRNLVLDFITFLRKKGYAPSSINQRLSAIKAYLWYVADDNILVQPTALIISRAPFVKEPKLTRPIIPDEALKAIFDAPKDSKIGLRDRTMMIVLYDSANLPDEKPLWEGSEEELARLCGLR